MSSFTFIDLFAGIGGFHQALHEIGGQCVFASEMDKFARKTYEANFRHISPDVFFLPDRYNHDITEVDLDVVPDFDMLTAGFPCQPFSQAGKRQGFNDTRGTLFFDIMSLVTRKVKEGNAPKVLLLENVKGLIRHDKGQTLETIQWCIEDMGYKFAYKVLNSKDYGLPQSRARVFMVAWLPSLSEAFDFPSPVDPATPTRVGDILEDEVDDKYTLTDHQWNYHQERALGHKRKGNGFGFGLVSLDSPHTRTLVARYYKDGKEILIEQDGKNPRRLTPRECSWLQGFPKDFVIPVSNTQAYKQFGNAVSVPVARLMGSAIKRQLLDKSEE